MVSMSSTLVETVSINYEDFNESFLTCGTCLCMYDGQEHTPKLLPCSHTVCLHCLGRIAASQTRDTGSFRCPICRELFHIPRGGVSAIPPSFLVNQLLDLMSRQRREVVPKCSDHINQELLFCETCDTVFCSQCAGGSNGGHSSAPGCEHTIVPFGIAMKRMSEILLYRANECAARLQSAHESVAGELGRLEQAAAACCGQVDATFAAISGVVAARRAELMDSIAQAAKDKRRVLEEQMALIDAEKTKVERECEGLQQQVEVRSITQRIAGIQEQLEAASLLAEPRENAFLACDLAPSLATLETALAALGRVRSSTTFPALCTVRLEQDPIVQLEATAIVRTVDYHGNPRTTGGDPISVSITQTATSPNDAVDATVEDCEDGSYRIRFRPPTPGDYDMKVSVLERPIKRCPASLRVSKHNEPIAAHGGRGSGELNLLQPVAVAVEGERVFVLDTGNSRIKMLDEALEFAGCIDNEGLQGRSCTGIAVSSRGLVVVNWRTRVVTEMTFDGVTLSSFTHPAFQEPISVAVDNAGYGHVMVADNGASCVFVFDAAGKFLFQVGKKGTAKGSFNLISSVTVGPLGEIIVADSRIQVFSAKGDYLQELCPEGKGRGRYGGVVADSDGHVIATRCEKAGSVVQVLRLDTGALLATLDSHDSKLKRASGLAVLPGNHVVVVDLGNDAVKKYRYW